MKKPIQKYENCRGGILVIFQVNSKEKEKCTKNLIFEIFSIVRKPIDFDLAKENHTTVIK